MDFSELLSTIMEGNIEYSELLSTIMEKNLDSSELLKEFKENVPGFAQMLDYISDLLDDGSDDAQGGYYSIEIDDEEYLIYKEFEIDGDTYYYLINVDDPADIMFRKQLIEDGEEFMIGLDDEDEFDLVFTYTQKLMFDEILEKQAKRDAGNASSDGSTDKA